MKFHRRHNSKSEPDSASAEQGDAAELLDLAGARISDIARATDRASSDIRDKLSNRPEEGSESSRDRLVAELTSSLVDRADQLGREAAELAALLGRARAQIEAEGPALEPPAPSPPSTEPPDEADGPQAAVDPELVREGSIQHPSAGPATEIPPREGSAEEETAQVSSAIDQRVSDRFSDTASGKAMPFRPRKAAPSVEPSALNGRSTEGIRLLATQMAVAGSSRQEIEARLRSEFGVDDAGGILADVLRPRNGGQRVAG